MDGRARQLLLAGACGLFATLGGQGCVAQASYDAAIADATRLKNELWQRNMELATARWVADRLAQENASLRATLASAPAGIASRVEDLSRRQDRVEEQVRSLENKLIPAPTTPVVAPTAPPRDPLRSRF